METIRERSGIYHRLSPYRDGLTAIGLSFLVFLQLLQRYLNITNGGSEWSWDVRVIWAQLAAYVADGVPLYVLPAVDNKPPLWKLITVGLMNNFPRGILLVAVAVANVALVLGVFTLGKRRYGYWTASFISLLLVGALPSAAGLEYQPHNFAAALIVFGVIASGSFATGMSLGAASMFVQYGGLALPALLLKVHRENGLGRESLVRFWTGFASVLIPSFLAVTAIWGWESLRGALYWTFVAPVGYVLGRSSAEPPYSGQSTQYSPIHNPVYWGDLVLDFVLRNAFIVLPAVGVGALIAIRRNSDTEIVDVVAVGCLLTPLLVRGLPHYWLFPLPFMCLLTGRFLVSFSTNDY